jgi:hypothetical protein
MSKDDPFAVLHDLRTIIWEEELRRLLHGERALSVLQLGGLQDYIAMLLAESDDRPGAETVFHDALSRVVTTWEPRETGVSNFTDRMLDLIIGFVPPEGFPKLLGDLKYWGMLVEHTVSQEEIDSDRLHRKWLLALSLYFPVPPLPPADESPAYKAYTALLKTLIGQEQTASHGVRRLLELNLLSRGDPALFALISSSEAALMHVVEELLQPSPGSDTETLLSPVFAECLRMDRVDAFMKAVEESGAQFVLEVPPHILTADGRTVSIDVQKDLAPQLMKERWLRARTGGLRTYRELPN